MTVQDYVDVVRRRLFSVIVIMVVTVGLAAAWTFTTPKTYTATASVAVKVGELVDRFGSNAQTGQGYIASRMATYAALATAGDVLDAAGVELGISRSDLSGSVQATNPLNTSLVTVTATAGAPEVAAARADAVAVALADAIADSEAVPGQRASVLAEAQTAAVPTAPTSPRVTVNLALGLILGLALGLGWAFLRESMDRRLRTAHQVQEAAGEPPLAQVAAASRSTQGRGQPDDDAYRLLRATVLHGTGDAGPRVIAITDCGPRVTDPVAAGLSRSLASAGATVCLFDLVEGEDARPGVSDVLGGRARVGEVLYPMQPSGLVTIPVGGSPADLAEALAGPAFADLLREAAATHDFVVLRAAPVLGDSEGVDAAAAADATILVIRQSGTTATELEQALVLLERVQARVLGTVLVPNPGRAARRARSRASHAASVS